MVGKDWIKVQVAPVDKTDTFPVIIYCTLYTNRKTFRSPSKDVFNRIMIFVEDRIGSDSSNLKNWSEDKADKENTV